MSIPEWLPEWRDAAQYPDPENTSYTQFAWEFLRRNSEYQSDFEKCGLSKGHVCSPSEEDCEICAQGSDRSYLLALGDQTLEFYEAALKWGILSLNPPWHPAAPVFLNKQIPYTWVGDGENGDLPRERAVVFNPREGELLVVYDVRYPLESQEIIVGKLLREKRDKLKQKHSGPLKALPSKTELHIQLRILDAMTSGVDDADIEENIFADKIYPEFEKANRKGKHVHTLIAPALTYRDWRYSRLPALDSLRDQPPLQLNMPRDTDITEQLIAALRAKKKVSNE